MGGMTLRQYLQENGLSQAQFARKLGVKSETVRRYLVGERIPDKEKMAQIAFLTREQVTANDFYHSRIAA
jgi:transcriptional regulator with XRE-family HTH domain